MNSGKYAFFKWIVLELLTGFIVVFAIASMIYQGGESELAVLVAAAACWVWRSNKPDQRDLQASP